MVSCTAPTKNSEPSGLALAASDAPTVPAAPPLLSTMICWPSWSPTCAARGRRKASVPPPAGNGLRKTIGPFGQAWARTMAGSTSEAARPSLRARRREVLNSNFIIALLPELLTVLLVHRLQYGLKLGAQMPDQKFP